MVKMKQVLEKLNEHESLSANEASDLLIAISESKYNDIQISAFVSSFMMRSITVEELSGFQNALLHLANKVNIDPIGKIDMCGTGGDGKNTFNISTISSVVAASTGLKVTKHGNYGVSSICGSSNVLESLGYQFSNDGDELQRQLDQCNICFIHAPLFHPAMKAVGPIRKKLGLKTFFNMLGPLVNPIQPEYQSVGVFSLKLQRLYDYIFQKTRKKYAIIHDLKGYDEISLTGQSKLVSNQGTELISHEDFGIDLVHSEEIHGGNTIEEAKQIFLAILKNESSNAHINVVCANVACALHLYKPDQSLEDLFQIGKEAIESGRAFSNFNKLLSL